MGETLAEGLQLASGLGSTEVTGPAVFLVQVSVSKVLAVGQVLIPLWNGDGEEHHEVSDTAPHVEWREASCRGLAGLVLVGGRERLEDSQLRQPCGGRVEVGRD